MIASEKAKKYFAPMGIPEFFLPREKPLPKCLILENVRLPSFCRPSPEQDLLHRMLGAIDISPNAVLCRRIDAADLEKTITENPAKTVLLLDENFAPSAKNQFQTHHPHTLMKDKKYKKSAWEVLQKLRKYLDENHGR